MACLRGLSSAKFQPQCMHPAPIKSNERCKTLFIWPSLSEMKHRKEKIKKKKKEQISLKATQQQSQGLNPGTLTTSPA